jgi:glycosyltransferase involved in cell wall biosynthesis
MTPSPLVSVIVPTRNSASTLAACLTSVRAQSYEAIELVVVDNYSTDSTVATAQRHADVVVQCGPERSAQRNYGTSLAHGEIVFFLDSDNTLAPTVIAEVVMLLAEPSVVGVSVPEYGSGRRLLARAKALERSFYNRYASMQTARACKKTVFERVGGYRTDLTGVEDWDLSQRLAAGGHIAATRAGLVHDDSSITVWGQMRKKFYYGLFLRRYQQGWRGSWYTREQLGVWRRLWWLWQGADFVHRLAVSGAMLLLKVVEIVAGGAGYVLSFFYHPYDY